MESIRDEYIYLEKIKYFLNAHIRALSLQFSCSKKRAHLLSNHELNSCHCSSLHCIKHQNKRNLN